MRVHRHLEGPACLGRRVTSCDRPTSRPRPAHVTPPTPPAPPPARRERIRRGQPAARSPVFCSPARSVLKQPWAAGTVSVTSAGEEMQLSINYLFREIRPTDGWCTGILARFPQLLVLPPTVLTKTGTGGNS